MTWKKNYSKEQLLQKLKHYCAYQERAQQEVKEKLFSLGASRIQRDEIMVALIEENYLNEERFAVAYAGGKWRIQQWGRTKIKYELKQRQISDYCIRKALAQIDDESYLKVLEKLLLDKYGTLKNLQWIARKKRTMDHAVSRGFESSLVIKTLDILLKRG
jgi:regulatory protein